MPRQLSFDLPVRTALGRADFFVSPANALAVAAIDASASWPQGKFLLIGPKGAGKTHLAMVWATEAGAAVVAARDLGAQDLAALAQNPAILIEDVDMLAGDPLAETRLFHLHNLALANQARLLMTAPCPALRLPFVLPDLASRLQACATATLNPPDDALLAAVLVKLFSDRQVAAPPSLITYLLGRIDRSFASANALVTAIDARALAEGRPVGRALAAEVLDSWAAPGP
jgi:chromosomal replication initiation ATPase DnaA